ncbi:MAG: YihY/virulence factor BrkB family protein [Bryocella sp.]
MQDATQDGPETTRTSRKDYREADPEAREIWDMVSQSPLRNLWNFQGIPVGVVFKRAMNSFLDDNLLSRAAELGYYFLFALFPMLVSASAILGLAAKRASVIYIELLHYLALIMPPSAFALVEETFNQTTAASTAGKVTFGLVAAIWAASVGFSAIQDGMNTVYRVKETRPYWKARGSAILVTMLLSVVITVTLAMLLVGDFAAKYARVVLHPYWFAIAVAVLVHAVSIACAITLLLLLFATIYYYAPDLKANCWLWLTPGAAIGIIGWLLASFALRLYLHYFNSYSLTYGSLGAVIILLTWFYITGLMLLIGAEINSEIQAAVTEKKLKENGVLPQEATTDKAHPVEALSH